MQFDSNLRETLKQFDSSLRNKLKLYLNICLGIFLFVIFFQPFELNFDFNNRLLFIAGLSAITFFIFVIIYLILPGLFPKTFDFEEWKYNPDLFVFSVILIINTVAYVFYLKYVGTVSLSFFLVFKITLLGIGPIALLKIFKEYELLNQQINSLHEENRKFAASIPIVKNDEIVRETFYSENKSEKIEVELNDILVINSADNYVKIVYRENGRINHKLIRNTLKNIEEQLSKYSNFFRCHRTSIVNKKHVIKLTKSYTGYQLEISDYKEEIPVSRQYIMKVRDAVGNV